MGLNAAVLELMANFCRRSEPGEALVAGYPDVLVQPEDMLRILGTDGLPMDRNAEAILVTHGAHANPTTYDAEAVFDTLGYKMNVIDVHADRGCETIVDLNYPATLGSYDLVLDHGTCEHVFNIGEAGLSLAKAVKVGGFLVMHLPLAFMAHGFYGVNPEWFRSLCRQCGMDILFLSAWNEKHGYLGIDIRTRFSNPPDKTLMSMVAIRRTEGTAGYPIQDLYQ